MSVKGQAVRGVAWTALAGWVQLAAGLLAYFLASVRLGPGALGVWSLAALLVGAGDMLVGGPLCDSVQQRADLEDDARDATFWFGQALAVLIAVGLIAGSGPITKMFGAPQSAGFLRIAAIGLPLGAASSFFSALLGRSLSFNVIARVNIWTSLLGTAVAITGVALGFGVVSLLAAELSGRLLRVAALWRASAYRPRRPARISALGKLMRFNRDTLATYVIGYADSAAPAYLTAFFLGPQALGYLGMAQRVLGMLHQIIIGSLSEVAMASAARVQADPAALKSLVQSLYRLATFLAYPAFLGAVVLTPDLLRLLGPRWAGAALPTQLLLLVGLRTATGSFNIAILRGVGRSLAPLILLSLGLALNVAFIPPLTRFGAAGVAAAVVARTFATWPLGAWMIKHGTGLSYTEQARAGGAALGAAVIMMGTVFAFTRIEPWEEPVIRIAAGCAVGVAIYGLLLLAFSPGLRATMAPAAMLFKKGDLREGARRLRHAMTAETARPA